MDLPDVLDLLGLAITEVGSVQVAVESAKLYWPSGEARVTVLLQSAWSGAASVELQLAGAGQSATRTVRVSEGEVRRVRLPLHLAAGAAPLELQIRAPISVEAHRIRAAWLKEAPAPAATGTDGVGAVLFSAFKHALGKREKRIEARGPEQGSVAPALDAVGASAPIAAEEETLWIAGMPVPEARGLSTLEPVPAAALTATSRVDRSSERPECPACYTRADIDLVRVERHCPACGADWVV